MISIGGGGGETVHKHRPPLELRGQQTSKVFYSHHPGCKAQFACRPLPKDGFIMAKQRRRGTSRYVTLNRDGSLYVGVTDNLQRRGTEHEKKGRAVPLTKVGPKVTRESALDWERRTQVALGLKPAKKERGPRRRPASPLTQKSLDSGKR